MTEADRQSTVEAPEALTAAPAGGVPAAPAVAFAPGAAPRSGADIARMLAGMSPTQRAAAVRGMQGGAGNRAVARLLNPELAEIAARRQQRLADATTALAGTPA